MSIRRLASALVLAALTLAGTATAASASAPPPSPTHSLAGTYRQAPPLTPVQACERALVRAHRSGSASAEDRALMTCARLIRTQAQADALYEWASVRPWALDMLG